MTTGIGTLPDMQRWMMEALIAPGRVATDAVEATFKAGAHIGAAACLGIYQRSYILRLRQCLIEQFPATAHALGEDLFCDFADEYLLSCPSDSYTLYELGRRFPAWISDNRPDRDLPEGEREGWIDFMIDLASYERTLFHLFDAPGHEGKAWPTGTESDQDLVVLPCLKLASYRFPVAWYYHEVRAGNTPQHPGPMPQHVAILRRDYQTTTYPISPFHHRFLSAVRMHDSIDLALVELSGWSGRPLADLKRSWLQEVRAGWLEAGFFITRDERADA